MIKTTAWIFVLYGLLSCNNKSAQDQSLGAGLPIEGTWELLSGTLIENEDTVTTDYTRGQKMIKVINASHFAFLRHDLNKGKDSAIYSSGGGTYALEKDQYTEHLEYCSERGWEGHSFQFKVTVSNDTLIQTGIEKVENLGIDRLNIEKYIRVKNKP